MNSREILELTGYFVGTGVFLWAANELGKKYVNWAEKNKFYDNYNESPKFSDLEKKTNYIGKTIEFKGNEIKEI